MSVSELVDHSGTAPLGVACGSATPPNVASLLGGNLGVVSVSELVGHSGTAPLGVACGSATPPNVASLLGGGT
ncbi:MAG TPA: hypothetical protein VLB67_03610, partial [Acidimicrobiia bacterium]|nr:hypothetical protein [Acidimicrobiia bacterium]